MYILYKIFILPTLHHIVMYNILYNTYLHYILFSIYIVNIHIYIQSCLYILAIQECLNITESICSVNYQIRLKERNHVLISIHNLNFKKMHIHNKISLKSRNGK